MEAFRPTRAQSRAIQNAIDPTNVNTPTAIAGPAGSGKTLVAAEIANRFTSQGTIDSLGTNEHPDVYFVTFTRALKGFVENQLTETLGADKSGITVLTVHKYLKDYLLNNGFESFNYFDGRRAFLDDYIADNKESLGLTGCLADVGFLDEEIGWLLGQGIRSLQRYLDMQRTGRRTGLNKQQREKVFRAYSAYMGHVKSEGSRTGKRLIDFDDIGNQVIHHCEQHGCTPVPSKLIVDEVQDLAETWIDALRRTTSGKIVYAGDPSQSIYGRGFTWTHITGKRVRPIHLTEDFRSTQQIYLAARSIMDFDHNAEGETGRMTQRRRNGDKPKLIFCKDWDTQAQRIIRLVAELRAKDPMGSIAIAAPRRECLKEIDRRCQVAILTTLHSLKGLEADHVILASLDEDVFDFTNEYTQEDTNRHLLYVGMTRAKKTLTMMTSTNQPASVLIELSADYIDLDDSENPEAHQALLGMRASRAHKSRESFEQLVDEKVEKEDAVERVESELRDATIVSDSGGADNTRIAKLEKELKRLREQQRKSEEKLQRQEDELRIYRAREKSDSTVPETGEKPERQLSGFVDNATILILGGLGVKPKDIPGIFKQAGLPRDAFTYLDYDEVHSGKFDASELLYTIKHSDIFVSTTPHSVKGIDDSSSLVEYLEANKRCLPQLTVFKNEDGTLKKASKTDLKRALLNSALYAEKRGI